MSVVRPMAAIIVVASEPTFSRLKFWWIRGTMFRSVFLSLRLAAICALPLLLSGCPLADVLGLDTVGERAVIIYAGDTSEVTVPESVTRGVSFEIRIRTFGGGCTRRTGRTHVVERANELVILPYNKRGVGDGVCTADIKYLTHAVEVTREQPGELLVRIIGHREDRSTNFQAVPAELTVSVTIR